MEYIDISFKSGLSTKEFSILVDDGGRVQSIDAILYGQWITATEKEDIKDLIDTYGLTERIREKGGII